MFPEVIETERLRLERLHRDRVDPHDYYEVVGDADELDGVVEHMPWDVHAHPKESFDYVARQEERWDDGERATWLVRPREGEDGTETADAAEDSTEAADAAEDGAGAIAG